MCHIYQSCMVYLPTCIIKKTSKPPQKNVAIDISHRPTVSSEPRLGMLKRFESISLGQGQGPKAHGVGRDGFFSGKKTTGNTPFIVFPRVSSWVFITVVSCCFPILLGESEVV